MSKPETVDKTALMDIVLEEATVTLNRYIEDVESGTVQLLHEN